MKFHSAAFRGAALLISVSFLLACSACGAQSSSGSVSAASSSEAAESADAGSEKTTTEYTGTVSAISADSIALTTSDGENVVILLSDSTVFTFGKGTGGPDGGRGEGGRGGEQMPGDIPDGTAESGSDTEENTLQAFSNTTGAPQQPGENSPDTAGRTPPEDGDGSALPDMADGKPSGFGSELTYEDVSVGDTVTVTVGSDGAAQSVVLSGGIPDADVPAAPESSADSEV